jgi:hypothetical protein
VELCPAAIAEVEKINSWETLSLAKGQLEKGYEERFNPGVLLRPGFDPLRTDSRFQTLVHRIGLPG